MEKNKEPLKIDMHINARTDIKPYCSNCGSEMIPIDIDINIDKELETGIKDISGFRCEKCGRNHLDIEIYNDIKIQKKVENIGICEK